jgi:hypothetical protein
MTAPEKQVLLRTWDGWYKRYWVPQNMRSVRMVFFDKAQAKFVKDSDTLDPDLEPPLKEKQFYWYGAMSEGLQVFEEV